MKCNTVIWCYTCELRACSLVHGCVGPRNIVLLDANPLEGFKNTQAILRVIKGGWVFDPEELRPPSGN